MQHPKDSGCVVIIGPCHFFQDQAINFDGP